MHKYAWIVVGIVGLAELLAALFLAARLFLPSTSNINESDEPSFAVPTLQSSPSTDVPYPSQVLDLTNWKLTLPVGTVKKPNRPEEIRQPTLATYEIDPWFLLTTDEKGVQFRAPVSGLTTGGTKYPRSELREMTDEGKANAAWSSTEGTHTMFIDQAITALPKVKRQVVAGQIHDDNEDIIVIRLDYPKLYVNVSGKNVYALDSNYSLGKRFTVKFVVNDGQTKVYYNGSTKPSHVLDLDYSDSYFKAGVYTQSNCVREGSAGLCNADNYGEVVIYDLTVTHE